MRSVRGKDTEPEIRLRKLLWNAGLRGYRKHVKSLPGTPDLAYRTSRLAIFVHGCFWHGCPRCQRKLPKTNAEFWRLKIEGNAARDARKNAELVARGYRVETVWACELKKSPAEVLARIAAIRREPASGASPP